MIDFYLRAGCRAVERRHFGLAKFCLQRALGAANVTRDSRRASIMRALNYARRLAA